MRIKDSEETKGGVYLEMEVIMDAAETRLVAVTILTGPVLHMMSYVVTVMLGIVVHSANLINKMHKLLTTVVYISRL